jgi:hypothetical protein
MNVTEFVEFKMNIQEIEIEKLIPYHNNPRKDQAIDKVASSINEYGLVHESIKATIKNFKDKEDSLSQDVVYEFQKILESIEKQAECIVDVY